MSPGQVQPFLERVEAGAGLDQHPEAQGLPGEGARPEPGFSEAGGDRSRHGWGGGAMGTIPPLQKAF